eukprot:Trichotokara_eunicae@DN5829_c0_g1_i6.p1
MRVDKDDKRTKIYFYVNDRCLGLGFDFTSIDRSVYPVVSFESNGSVSIETEDPPACIEVQQTEFSGAWRSRTVENGLTIGLSIDAEDGGYRIGAKYVNNLSVKLDQDLKGGPVASTLMAGSESQMAFEQKLSKFLTTLTKMEVKGEMLTLESPEMNLSFKRETAAGIIGDRVEL